MTRLICLSVFCHPWLVLLRCRLFGAHMSRQFYIRLLLASKPKLFPSGTNRCFFLDFLSFGKYTLE